MQLTPTTIHPSCRCNNQQGSFPLFLGHGHGRTSEPEAQITAAILIETFEWISKVYTERIATDRFSLGQQHYYFLRLWKGKVLTDLLEMALVFPPTCSQLLSQNASSLSHAHSGKTTLPSRAKRVFCCVRDTSVCIWFIVHFPIRLPRQALAFPAQRACLGSLSFQQK